MKKKKLLKNIGNYVLDLFCLVFFCKDFNVKRKIRFKKKITSLGSFRCECNMGYIHRSPGTEQACVDIDECEMFDNLCVYGRCENNNGGFQCICDDGFVLDKTGGNCTGNVMVLMILW